MCLFMAPYIDTSTFNVLHNTSELEAGLPNIYSVSDRSTLSDILIVYTNSRKQLLHRKNLLYDTGCIYPSIDLESCSSILLTMVFNYQFFYLSYHGGIYPSTCKYFC